MIYNSRQNDVKIFSKYETLLQNVVKAIFYQNKTKMPGKYKKCLV